VNGREGRGQAVETFEVGRASRKGDGIEPQTDGKDKGGTVLGTGRCNPTSTPKGRGCGCSFLVTFEVRQPGGTVNLDISPQKRAENSFGP